MPRYIVMAVGHDYVFYLGRGSDGGCGLPYVWLRGKKNRVHAHRFDTRKAAELVALERHGANGGRAKVFKVND